MTAADIEYSLERIIDKQVASPGSWIFNRKADTIQPFKAIDDSTFQLKLLRPYNPILGILSMQYCSVPKEVVEMYGTDFRRRPVGTGPFRFVHWEEGQALVLKKAKIILKETAPVTGCLILTGLKLLFMIARRPNSYCSVRRSWSSSMI